jgi:hypothetical protein
VAGDTGDPIDWRLTTWEGSRRGQLRRWAALPLDRVIAALEEMAELADTLRTQPDRSGAPVGAVREDVHRPGSG